MKAIFIFPFASLQLQIELNKARLNAQLENAKKERREWAAVAVAIWDMRRQPLAILHYSSKMKFRYFSTLFSAFTNSRAQNKFLDLTFFIEWNWNFWRLDLKQHKMINYKSEQFPSLLKAIRFFVKIRVKLKYSAYNSRHNGSEQKREALRKLKSCFKREKIITNSSSRTIGGRAERMLTSCLEYW